jgi:hypothetical protein
MRIVHFQQQGGNVPNRRRLAEQILRLLRGRDDFIAVGTTSGFRPEALTALLTAERLAAEHLGGKGRLAFYLLKPEHRVWCSCCGFDNKTDPPDLECTAHPAWVPQAFWHGVLATLGIAVPEIYPRHDRLSGKGLGILVRYPFWGKSHLVDVTAGWKALLPITTMAAVSAISAADLTRAAASMIIAWQQAPQPVAVAQPVTISAAGLSPHVRRFLAEDGLQALRDPFPGAALAGFDCGMVCGTYQHSQ